MLLGNGIRRLAMAEAEARVTKGRPRTTKTLAWRDTDEAVLRRLRAQVAARFGVVVTERDRPPSATAWNSSAGAMRTPRRC